MKLSNREEPNSESVDATSIVASDPLDWISDDDDDALAREFISIKVSKFEASNSNSEDALIIVRLADGDAVSTCGAHWKEVLRREFIIILRVYRFGYDF